MKDLEESKHRVTNVILALLTLVLSGANNDAAAQQSNADKSDYNLFNPTPRHLMRDLSADRPDVTESPITVDAGHIQVELSFLDYRYDDRNSNNTEFEVWTFGATNIKFGLFDNVDLQFVFDAYTEEDTDDKTAGTSSIASGFNDIQFRLKINLWGNDGGATAFAVMPFVQFPTGSDDLSSDHVQGGLIFPFATELGNGWGLGLMAEVDWVYDEDDGDYDTEFVHTVVLGHDILGSLNGYVEYIGNVSGDGDTDYRATIGTGLTYALSANVVLDAGANFGMTKAAEDVNVFAGMTLRF